MTDGVLHPNLAVPIGTFTGWNLRSEGYSTGEQCGGTGSFIPFARTRAERESSGDPRLSLEEHRLLECESEEECRRQPPIREVVGLAERNVELVDRAEAHQSQRTHLSSRPRRHGTRLGALISRPRRVG